MTAEAIEDALAELADARGLHKAGLLFYRCALRGFFAWCAESGLLAANPYPSCKAPLRVPLTIPAQVTDTDRRTLVAFLYSLDFFMCEMGGLRARVVETMNSLGIEDPGQKERS